MTGTGSSHYERSLSGGRRASIRRSVLLSLLVVPGLLLWNAGGDLVHAKQACAPYCGDAVCGPDGCGGSCGECPEGALCGALGICDLEGCTDECLLGSAGCEDDVAWSCEKEEDGCTVEVLTDCKPLGATCQGSICVGGAAGFPGASGPSSSGGDSADAGSSDVTAGGSGSAAGSSSDAGCALGGEATWSLWSLLALVAMIRRREARVHAGAPAP